MDSMEENVGKKYLVPQQKELLIEFLEKHPDLKSGKFSATFTKKKSDNLWNEAAVLLNSIPCGAIKTGSQWKRTWQDIRKYTKSKASQIRTHRRGTGGGSKTKIELSGTENRICDIIGETAIMGHPGVSETKVSFSLTDAVDDLITIDKSNDDPSGDININDTNIGDVGATDNTADINDVAGVYDDIEEQEQLESVSHTPIDNTSKTPKEKTLRLFSTTRLENTILASKKLAAIAENKTNIKSDYYDKKLKLMECAIAIDEEKVQCLRELSNNITGISYALRKMADTMADMQCDESD